MHIIPLCDKYCELVLCYEMLGCVLCSFSMVVLSRHSSVVSQPVSQCVRWKCLSLCANEWRLSLSLSVFVLIAM